MARRATIAAAVVVFVAAFAWRASVVDRRDADFGATTAAAPKSRTLRVLTYNVQLLPVDFLNKRRDDAYRAAELGRRLVGYDLIGLNEVYEWRRRTTLLDGISAAWGKDFRRFEPPNSQRTLWGLDSGCVVLSRLPITASDSTVFGNGSPVAAHGLEADGFADKGVLYVRLNRNLFPGDEARLDVFVTHLESHVPALRDEQYAMTADFIRRRASDDTPILLLGDLNTIGDAADIRDSGSQYNRLRRALDGVRSGWIDVGAPTDGIPKPTFPSDDITGGRRIDYVFLSNPPGVAPLKVRSCEVLRFADPRVDYLSDHSAVEAVLEW